MIKSLFIYINLLFFLIFIELFKLSFLFELLLSTLLSNETLLLSLFKLDFLKCFVFVTDLFINMESFFSILYFLLRLKHLKPFFFE